MANSSYVFFNTSESGQIRRKLLKGTHHNGKDLKAILSRLEGAVGTQHKIMGTNSRGVMIPIALVHGVDPKPWPTISGEKLMEDPDLDDI